MPDFKPYNAGKLKGAIDELLNRVYTPIADLKTTAYWSAEPLPYADRRKGRKSELKVGDAWGKLFDCAWFHFQGAVPKSAAGKKVVLLLDANGELCVFDSKGVPIRGLTTTSSHFGISPPGKRVVQVSAKAAGGERIAAWQAGTEQNRVDLW